jgi:hypothetical protein
MSESKTEPREYVVLAADPAAAKTNAEVWVAIGKRAGTSAKQAIEAVVSDLPAAEQDGTFVAVPMRSWRPLHRKTETITKALWS